MMGPASAASSVSGENVLTPRLKSGVRLHLLVSDADFAKVQRGQPWSAVVTDHGSGRRFRLRDAACSLSTCRCDAVVVAQLRK